MGAKLGKWITRLLKRFIIWFVGLSVFFVVVFRFVPVPFTPLMLIRSVEQLSEGKKILLHHKWISFELISAHLALAVVSSEDQKFLDHSGFDFKAIKESLTAFRKGQKRLRGASTISQQTAKNIFLWPGRSWARKGLEVYFTTLIELIWTKKRILEVYLNSIEMGEGVFGAEAAARYYFGKSASHLSKNQAAALAAVLPNPREYVANPPSPYVQSRKSWILQQMNQLGALEFE